MSQKKNKGTINCGFCGLIFEYELKNPIERVECPRCMALVEFHLENTTVPGQWMIFARVLKEGSGKFATKRDNKTQYL